MKLQIIQLEPYDDVASVRDRLAFVKAERVLLVWPRSVGIEAKPILSRKLDLVLIQREAARRGAWLAIISSEPDVLDYAAELNISVFGSVKASQRERWKKPLNKVFVDRSDRPDNAPDPRELMLHASRLRVLSPRQRLMRRLTRLLSAGVLLATFASVVYLILPGAYITLTPAQEQIDTAVPLIADTSITQIDPDNGRIPGTFETIEVESQASIRTTGTKDIPSTLASGTVVFTNRIESAVDIPAGTIVFSTGSKPAKFRTLVDATVDAGVGKRVTVTIQALEESAGPAGNIEADLIINIEGDLARLLSVRNPEPTQGGTVREQRMVMQADYDSLVELAREKVRQDALTRFSARLSGKIIAPDSIKIENEGNEEITYNAFVGDPADTLTLTMRARVRALFIDEQAARQAALSRLTAEIPPGRVLALESVQYSRGPIRIVGGGRQVSFVMSASGNVTMQIDPEYTRQRVAGLPIGEALNVLNREWLLDPRRPPEIQVWPEFLGQLPVLPARISVEVRQ